MARNLQAKLPSTDTLKIFDINSEMVERFAKETKTLDSGAAVEIASSVREAAEDSVGSPFSNFCSGRFALCDEFVLSMI